MGSCMPKRRNRIQFLADALNEIQEALENDIGRRRVYDRYFTCSVRDERAADLIIIIIKYAMPDLVSCEKAKILASPYIQVRGLVRGKNRKNDAT